MTTPEQPMPDPGNAPPEDWTEELTDEEWEAVMMRIQREAEDS